MNTVLHETITRGNKFEQPVTITLDDGTLIDEVLYFDSEPQSGDIDDAVAVIVDRYENKDEDPPEVYVAVKEVEQVLKIKKIITDEETWDGWKNKSVFVVKEIV